MQRKEITFIIVSSLVFGGIGGWLFSRYVIPKINSIPFLVKYNLSPSSSPLVINTREEIHVNEGSDTVAAIQKAQPWMVGVVSGVNSGNIQISASAVILSSDGLIGTTKAALSASGIENISLADGRVVAAKIVAQDPGSDLVFLKVDLKDLPVADLGSAKDLSLGQRMIVVAATLSGSHLATQVAYLSSEVGNIAGKIYSSDQKNQAFKIDGFGSLPEGAIALSSDGALQGIYARSNVITAENIKSDLDSYFKNGKIQQLYYGFYYQPLSKTLATLLNAKEGILVRRSDNYYAAVIPGSPAALGGLQEGDIITALNGNAINLDNSFEQASAKTVAGDSLDFTVARAGKEMHLTIKPVAK